MLVAQDRLHIEVYRRKSDGWPLESVAADERVRLASVDVEAPIETFYGTAAQWLRGPV